MAPINFRLVHFCIPIVFYVGLYIDTSKGFGIRSSNMKNKQNGHAWCSKWETETCRQKNFSSQHCRFYWYFVLALFQVTYIIWCRIRIANLTVAQQTINFHLLCPTPATCAHVVINSVQYINYVKKSILSYKMYDILLQLV